METAKKPKRSIEVLLAICVIALVVTNIRLNNRLSNIENAVNNVANSQRTDVSNVQHSIWDISRRIDSMGDVLIQSTRLSFDEIAQIQSFNRANATANVAVSFSLREHTIGDAVGITARGQSGETHSAVASVLDGRFTADITLPLRDNFTLSFTETGDTLTTGELMHFNLAEMLNRRFTYWLSQGSSVSGTEHTIWFTPSFRNETQGNSALEVQSLSLILEIENEIIRNWDLTPYLQIKDNLQLIQMEDYEVFRLDVSEGGDVAQNETAIARLLIYDNLGIRYEQVDMVFTGTGITHVAGRSFSSRLEVLPAPAQRVLVDGFHGEEWGFIRILD